METAMNYLPSRVRWVIPRAFLFSYLISFILRTDLQLEPGYPKGCRQYSNEMSVFARLLSDLHNKCAHAHMRGGGIFVRTPTETNVYFWSPAQAKVLFFPKAEVQSPVVIGQQLGLTKQFISAFQVELSFATRREYLTEDSFEKEC